MLLILKRTGVLSLWRHFVEFKKAQSESSCSFPLVPSLSLLLPPCCIERADPLPPPPSLCYCRAGHCVEKSRPVFPLCCCSYIMSIENPLVFTSISLVFSQKRHNPPSGVCRPHNTKQGIQHHMKAGSHHNQNILFF